MKIRKERSHLLLNHLKHKGGTVRIFVDEKKLVVDEVANRRNSLFIFREIVILDTSLFLANVAIDWDGFAAMDCFKPMSFYRRETVQK